MTGKNASREWGVRLTMPGCGPVETRCAGGRPGAKAYAYYVNASIASRMRGERATVISRKDAGSLWEPPPGLVDAGKPPRVARISYPARTIVLQFEDGQDGAVQPFADWLRSGAAWEAFRDWFEAAATTARLRTARPGMIADLQDDRRQAKTWLPFPGDDRDVTNGLVYEDKHGKPACWRHGAMNRVDSVRRIYRCSEMRCGVGAEITETPAPQDRSG